MTKWALKEMRNMAVEELQDDLESIFVFLKLKRVAKFYWCLNILKIWISLSKIGFDNSDSYQG